MSALDAYLATLPPMNAAKARAVLTSQVRHNGTRFVLRHKLIEEKVATGSCPAWQREELVLMGPDGAFFDTRGITKTGIDYATFIIPRECSVCRATHGREVEHTSE